MRNINRLNTYSDYMELALSSEEQYTRMYSNNLSFMQKIKAMFSFTAKTCYDILKEGFSHDKNRVIADLYKINIKEFHLFDWSQNDGIEPVAYNGCRIWIISECAYWYAIEYKQKYYAFDIRDICMKTGIEFPEADLIDKHKWLQNFVNQLEESDYFIDIEKSVNQ